MQGIEDSISGSISSGFSVEGFSCCAPDFKMSSSFIAILKGSCEWSRSVEFFVKVMLVLSGLGELIGCLEGVRDLNSKFDLTTFDGVLLLYLDCIYYLSQSDNT